MAHSDLPQSLSLVIPLFNEAVRFTENWPALRSFLEKQPGWELILVNDGSTDTTASVVRNTIQKQTAVQLVHYTQNRGKGYALKRGVAKASKKWVLLTDIDLSTPLSELRDFWKIVTPSVDGIIGTRKNRQAKVEKHQRPVREWCGKQFTKLANTWLGLTCSDFTCGFKLFKTPVAQHLFSNQHIERWGYDAELIFLAKQYHCQIRELPVVWRNDERTKVHLFTDTLRSFKELWLIRWYDWRGKYH